MKQTAKPILFASDLTPEMKQVFHHAATQALCQKTQIIILHVMKEYPQAEGHISLWFGKEKYQNMREKNRETAKKTLTNKDIEGHRIRQAIEGFFEEQISAQENVSLIKDILVKEGRSIEDEIFLTAIEEDCGMIVAGIGKQESITDSLGNTVVKKILKKTTVPVLIVPYSK